MKILLVALAMTGLSDSFCIASQTMPFAEAEKGRLVRKETPGGSYYRYVPSATDPSPRVLVISHGALKEGESALDAARHFIARWIVYAEKNAFILIAPAFDRKRYQTGKGYRGLFGRYIGADEFVNGIVDKLKDHLPSFNGRFYLYGHSAGGQFAVRYCVRHPQRIIRAVISAPGSYAFPDRKVTWPYGAGRLRRNISYTDPDESRRVDVQPEFGGWIGAVELPITIVVGASDLEKQPDRPGHRGRTRIDFARHWSEAMNGLARKHGKKGKVRLEIVDGVGHSSERLTPHCKRILSDDR